MLATYNLNGLIKVTVDAPSVYIRFFNNEYERISLHSDDGDVPSVTLKVVDRLQNTPKKYIRFKKLFKFHYCIQDLHTKAPNIYFQRHWLENIYATPLGAFVQGQLLEPVIYLKLLERNVLFMHAAGVARDGRAFVFPAHGGTGKTTLALALVNHGFELLGDDLLMVETNSGIVYPYARPLHLFAYNLKSLPVPFALKSIIRFKDVLRFFLNLITNEKFLISTRAHVEDILSVRFGKSSMIERIVFLTRDSTAKSLTFNNPLDLRQAANAILESADLNKSLSENIHDSEALRLKELEIVTALLSHVSGMEFVNPRTLAGEGDLTAFARQLDPLNVGIRRTL